jgi:hypothetical protein
VNNEERFQRLAQLDPCAAERQVFEWVKTGVFTLLDFSRFQAVSRRKTALLREGVVLCEEQARLSAKSPLVPPDAKDAFIACADALRDLLETP